MGSADSDAILAELRRIREALEMTHAAPYGALRRKVAAKAMGMGVTKLDALIRAGKIRTAEDSRLIPMSEIRRYCAPLEKEARQRRNAVRDAVDEAEEVRAALRRGRH